MTTSIPEKDVENNYRYLMKKMFPSSIITSPLNCDGLLFDPITNISILMEFKADCDLHIKQDMMKIIVQGLFYLKKLKNTNESYPQSLFIGDRNQCACIATNVLEKYLNRQDLNWDIAPCNAFNTYPNLVNELILDETICPYVFYIDSGQISLKEVKENIVNISKQTPIKYKINNLNVGIKFEEFCNKVMQKTKLNKEESRLFPSIFLLCLTNPESVFLRSDKNELCFDINNVYKRIKINVNQFNSFFSYFDRGNYSIEEKRYLNEIFDRLIQDEQRRFSGSFFTPTKWVNYAHDLINQSLGLNWKEEYVVWDCCCGTGNLTRDYGFSKLFCSTIDENELNIMIQSQCNPGATKFVYDFLSEMDIKQCPQELKDIFNDPTKKVLFFINPPFKESGSGIYSIYLKNNNQTSVYTYMMANKLGKTSSQLYTQFLSKIYCLSKEFKCQINIAFFSPFIFYSGWSFDILRSKIFECFKYDKGFIFNASEFSNVGNWPMSFSILKNGPSNLDSLNFKIIDGLNNKFKIISLTKNQDVFYRNEKQKVPYIETPIFSSGLVFKDQIKRIVYSNSLANINYLNNTIESSINTTYILSASPVTGVLYHITTDNFLNRMTFFTSRKLVDLTWINTKDLFKSPNFNHPLLKQFVFDGLIFTLFNGSNQASSLRNIVVQNQTFQIFNKLFWKTCDEMKVIANQKNNSLVYNDCIQYCQSRHVPTILPKMTFSEDAQMVLNKANDILIKTFDFRNQAHEEHPEWHVNTWDMSWYQINKMMKVYDPNSIKEFNELYKSLRTRMQPLVYELGFLDPPYYIEEIE